MGNIKLKVELYNRYAKIYEKRTKSFANKFIKFDIDLFLKNLPGKKIIDLGSGPGRDSLIFKQKGFAPLCLDISRGMLNLCKEKGLKTIQMDFNKMDFPKNSFDGAWTHIALTTTPKKETWKVIENINWILKNDGILFLGLIEGKGERWKPPNEKYDLPRFVSRYQTAEVLKHIKNFKLLYFRKIEKKYTGRNTYLNFMFRKIN